MKFKNVILSIMMAVILVCSGIGNSVMFAI